MAGAKSKYVLEAEDRTGKAFKSVTENARRVTNSVAKIGAAGLAAAAGGMAAIVAKNSEVIDSLAKTSDKLGIATEKLAAYRFAAEETANMASGQFDMALQRMTRRVAEAAQGTGEAASAIEELGLDAGQLAAMSPDQQFATLADRMSQVAGQGDRVRLAMRLFDSEGVNLVNTLALGSQGLRQYEADAEAMGIAISRVDAAKVEAANDSLGRVGKIASGAGQQLTVALAPSIEAVADELFTAAKEAGGFGEIANRAIGVVVKAAGYLGNTFRGLQFVWLGLKSGIADFAAFAIERFQFLARGIDTIAAAIPGVETNLTENLGTMTEVLREQAQTYRDELVNLAQEPMPLEQIEEWHAGVVERAQGTAERLVDINRAKNEALLGNELAVTSKQQALDKKAKATQLKNDKRNFMSSLQTASQQSKALFELNKVALIAQGIIDLKSAVMGAYRFGSSIGGPIVGAAFAAVAGAAQAANLAAIKSSSFGGGSAGGGGGGGSTPSVSSLVEQEKQRSQTDSSTVRGAGVPRPEISIEDDGIFSANTMRRFAESLHEYYESGGEVPA